MRKILIVGALVVLTSACSSVGQMGLITKPGANPGALLTQPTPYVEIGPARGKACRYFIVAVVPWGDSTVSEAVNNALADSGGDALLNVTVSSSLYGFVPIYNVLSWTCTEVKGTAIRFVPAPTPETPANPS